MSSKETGAIVIWSKPKTTYLGRYLGVFVSLLVWSEKRAVVAIQKNGRVPELHMKVATLDRGDGQQTQGTEEQATSGGSAMAGGHGSMGTGGF